MSVLARDERLARRVGVIALVSLAFAIACGVVIAHRRGEVRIQVYFRHVAGLREGAAFVAGGTSIGTVESIAAAPRDGVVVTVAIAPAMARRVMRGGDIFIASRGPLGERYLEIGPSPVPTPTLADGDHFRGRDPVSLDGILQRLWDGLALERELTDAVRPELTVLRARLGELELTLDRLELDPGDVAGLELAVRSLLAEVRPREVGEVLANGREALARARSMLTVIGPKLEQLGAHGQIGEREYVAIEAAIDRTRAMIEKLEPLVGKLADVSGRLARGEGTVGRLMNDLELVDDIRALTKLLKREPWTVAFGPQDVPQKPGVTSGPDD